MMLVLLFNFFKIFLKVLTNFFFMVRSSYRSSDFISFGELIALSLVVQTPENKVSLFFFIFFFIFFLFFFFFLFLFIIFFFIIVYIFINLLIFFLKTIVHNSAH